MLPSPRNELGLKCRRRAELLSIPLDSLHLVVFSATSLAQFSLASDLPAATSLRSTGYAFILVDTTLVRILVNQPTLVESIPAALRQYLVRLSGEADMIVSLLPYSLLFSLDHGVGNKMVTKNGMFMFMIIENPSDAQANAQKGGCEP
ncbi:hypothetical protein TWF706_004170 [Orbilia oligospora]|uniref:Uncharacterized protein n=1 Tax=Orbilia oligospora TaxID=2813651 RepID=A0A7C8NMI2_ORBOL|nr:hypothetical protein TWF706_004170 [Orbilia oligospora]KAF3120292.1 hypothetical protein TWF703_002671 [Orbilia oligospora]